MNAMKRLFTLRLAEPPEAAPAQAGYTFHSIDGLDLLNKSDTMNSL